MGLWAWLGWKDDSNAELQRQVRQSCGKDFVRDFQGFVDSFIQAVHAKGVPGAPPNERSRNAPPAPHHLVLPAVHRLVSIGDLHGDLRKTRQAFKLARLIDDEDRWIGGKTVAVQVGDQLDRGPDEIAILYFLERLKAEARLAGGALYVLNGNHETMNVKGQFRYATRHGVEGFHHWRVMQQLGAGLKAACGLQPGQCEAGRALMEMAVGAQARGYSSSDPAQLSRAAALEPGGPITRRFFAPNPVVLQVGSTVFAHAGILPDHVEYGLAKINKETSEWMLGKRPDMPRFLQGADAVVWTRRYSHVNTMHCQCNLLEAALKKMPGAERMVVGHTIQDEGINGACGNRVIRVDVGMSQGCRNGEAEVLEILDDRVVRRLRSGAPPEVLSAVREDFDRAEGPLEAVPADA